MLRFNIALAVAPALLLLWLFRKWDAKRPEPPGAVRNVVFLGVATCLPAIGIELGLSYVLGNDLVQAQGSVLNAFLIAATTEEILKLLVVMLFVWRKPHFDEVMDGILYTVAASLGFAMIENILYSAGNPVVGFMRAFTAVPLHATSAGVMGYFVGRAKVANNASSFAWIGSGLLFAILIHGFYDWALMSGGSFGVGESDPWAGFAFAMPTVLLAGFVTWLFVRHALKLDDQILGSHARPLLEPQPAYVAMNPAQYPGYQYQQPMPPPGYQYQQPTGHYPQQAYPQQPGYPPQANVYPPNYYQQPVQQQAGQPYYYDPQQQNAAYSQATPQGYPQPVPPNQNPQQ